MVKNLPANAGDVRDAGSIPGSERSPGGAHGNPLQYPHLENSMDRGAWWATVHSIAHSQTGLKQLSMQHAHGTESKWFSHLYFYFHDSLSKACRLPFGDDIRFKNSPFLITYVKL